MTIHLGKSGSDVHEMNNGRQPLEAFNERAHRMIDAANDAFLTWDCAGTIVEWNAQAEAIFGWAKGEAIGRDMASTILAPVARDTYERAMAQSSAGDSAPTSR